MTIKITNLTCDLNMVGDKHLSRRLLIRAKPSVMKTSTEVSPWAQHEVGRPDENPERVANNPSIGSSSEGSESGRSLAGYPAKKTAKSHGRQEQSMNITLEMVRLYGAGAVPR